MIPRLSSVLPFLLIFYDLAHSSSATLYRSPVLLPPSKRYDFIIVGGGAGGSVMANRLTEDPGTSVLVIEAGSSDFRNLDIDVPFFASRLTGSQFDWNFTSLPQPGLNDRSIAYARGFVLGGSTAINVMAFCTGSRDDFDRWSEVTEDSGWTWESLQPLMKKMERITPPADRHNITGEIDLPIHGTNGPVGMSLPGQLLPTDRRTINASQQLSDEFPFNVDYNSGHTIGIGWTQATIAHGQRVTAASAYLEPVFSRENLDILVNTQVTRVIQTGPQSGTPVMTGVEFAQASSPDVIYTLHATREVILSAGAIKTPQLLMLSGIGDASYLALFGIKAIIDLPDVGANLQDHPLTTISWTVNSSRTLDNTRINATFADQQLEQWNQSRTGDLVIGPGNQLGWFRLPENSTIFENVTDPSAGPTSAHFEFIPTDEDIADSFAVSVNHVGANHFKDGFVSFSQPFPQEGNFFTMFINLVSPASRGNISLASTDSFDHPLISSNLLDPAEPFDIFALREGIKAARRFMAAPAWDGWILNETSPSAEAQTDEDIEAYVRQTCFTVNHVSCTVPMGGNGTGRGSGALDSDLRVKGTVGLRVVDASAFPFIPAAHTQVPTYILAERAAEMLKKHYLAPE